MHSNFILFYSDFGLLLQFWNFNFSSSSSNHQIQTLIIAKFYIFNKLVKDYNNSYANAVFRHSAATLNPCYINVIIRGVSHKTTCTLLFMDYYELKNPFNGIKSICFWNRNRKIRITFKRIFNNSILRMIFDLILHWFLFWELKI